MANLPETSVWVNNVYQLEITDPVEGGSGGISNAQAVALTQRTRYLYDLLNKFMLPFIGGKAWVLFNDIVSNIPIGWAEVTEMRGRGAIGLDTSAPFNSIGNTGGAPNKTLSLTEIPAHSHGVQEYAGTEGTITSTHLNAPTNGAAGSKTQTVGGGQAFSIMNPYRVVTYIKYVG